MSHRILSYAGALRVGPVREDRTEPRPLGVGPRVRRQRCLEPLDVSGREVAVDVGAANHAHESARAVEDRYLPGGSVTRVDLAPTRRMKPLQAEGRVTRDDALRNVPATDLVSGKDRDGIRAASAGPMWINAIFGRLCPSSNGFVPAAKPVSRNLPSPSRATGLGGRYGRIRTNDPAGSRAVARSMSITRSESPGCGVRSCGDRNSPGPSPPCRPYGCGGHRRSRNGSRARRHPKRRCARPGAGPRRKARTACGPRRPRRLRSERSASRTSASAIPPSRRAPWTRRCASRHYRER